MKILQSIPELSNVAGPVVLAIGVFDGVHLGHKAVIERAVADAKSVNGTAVVLTFNPHPARVLRPERAPRLLTSTQHKIRLMCELGVTHLLVIDFNHALAELPPAEFIASLHAACKPLHEICVGHEWCFGRNRAGNLELLQRLGDQLGFDEVGVPAVQMDGNIISSTLIRAAIEEGDFLLASRFLGREYTILGTVVEGDQLGRKLGFPTANLSTHNEQFPPNGVYAVHALHNGKLLEGIVNIGVRPTVHALGGNRLLELHLFDFNQSIYGDEIEVYFKGYLRKEQKFASLENLKTQIRADIAKAQKLLETFG